MATTIRTSVSPKIENILFTTDFSSCSDAALPHARAIAQLFGATIHVLHVVPAEPLFGELGVVLPEGNPRHIENCEEARKQLDQLMRSDALKDIMCSQIVATGYIGEVVSELVDSLHLDLIVMGTHGRHGVKQLMLGSTAEYLFRNASCPVLTIGPEVHDGLATGKPHTILFATDFSPASRRALNYALFVARATQANLVLLHVMTLHEATLLSFDESVIQRLKNDLLDLIAGEDSIPHSVSVEIGTPADVIVGKAAETSAALIVMGAHKGASVAAHAPWAVAHRVVCEAPCAVLTVRA